LAQVIVVTIVLVAAKGSVELDEKPLLPLVASCSFFSITPALQVIVVVVVVVAGTVTVTADAGDGNVRRGRLGIDAVAAADDECSATK